MEQIIKDIGFIEITNKLYLYEYEGQKFELRLFDDKFILKHQDYIYPTITQPLKGHVLYNSELEKKYFGNIEAAKKTFEYLFKKTFEGLDKLNNNFYKKKSEAF